MRVAGLPVRKESKAMPWILRDGNSGKYFKAMAGIGPMLCGDIEEAQRFDTKQDAVIHPAYSFSLTIFEPMESPDA